MNKHLLQCNQLTTLWWPKTWLCCWHPISLLYSTMSRLLPDRESKALLWRGLSPISLLLRCWVALGEGWCSRILLLSRWWSPPLLRGPVTLLGRRSISLRRVTLLWWSVTWLLLTYKDSTTKKNKLVSWLITRQFTMGNNGYCYIPRLSLN